MPVRPVPGPGLRCGCDPRPATGGRARPGRCDAAARRAGRAGPAPVRRLRARAVLRDPLRLLRLQHLHRRRTGPRRQPGHLRRAWPSRRSGWPGGCSATARRAVGTVFFGGGTPTLLPPADLAAILRRDRRRVRPRARGRGDRRGEPGERRPAVPGRPARGRVHPDLDRHAERGQPTCWACWTAQHEPGRPQRCVAWARSAGFEHVSLDLIYGTPGESDADWRAVAAQRGGRRARPHLRRTR